MTKEDVDRYKESVSNPDFVKRTFIPGQIGENLRMNKGDKGIVSSFEYTGSTDKASAPTNIGLIYEALKKDAESDWPS